MEENTMEKKAMGLGEIILLLKVAEPLIKLVKKEHGFIHKRAEAEMYGKRGDLVWDYILYNEITFDDIDDINGDKISLFTSFSDDETERKWNELVNKYGVNNG